MQRAIDQLSLVHITLTVRAKLSQTVLLQCECSYRTKWSLSTMRPTPCCKKYTTQPPFVTLTVVVGLQLVTVDEVDVTLSV